MNYLTKLLLFLSFILLTFNTFALNKNESISVYNWWDFITSETQEKLKKEGFNFNVIEYRSNDVALSELLSSKSDFDVVIVSNWVLQVLNKTNYIDKKFNNNLLIKRKYLPFLKNLSEGCMPYMWATTMFAVETNNDNIKPDTLNSLLELKSKGFKISIVDDQMEFMARVFLDNMDKCLKKAEFVDPLNISKDCITTLEKNTKYFEPKDFRNSIENFINQDTAVYAWNGEVGDQLANHPNIRFILPKSNVLLGADFLCIPKKKKYKKDLFKFIEILTNEKTTAQQASKFQYFSPYVEHKVNYHPKIDKLKQELFERINQSSPVFLAPPQSEVHERINHLWQKVRFGKK